MAGTILYDEVMMEILSWLPVKSLVRFMCISKSFQSFISHPSFVKLHLQRSPKSVEFLVKYSLHDSLYPPSILPCPLASLDNPHSLIAHDHAFGFQLNDMYEVVGCCNGLVCFIGERNNYQECMFRVWNPATRNMFQDLHCVLALPMIDDVVGTFAFGYDNLTDTYKVVSIVATLNWKDGSLKSCEVKVCNLGDSICWRSIQSFPADPTSIHVRGVYLNCTLNWIALAFPHDHNHDYDDSDVTFDELVIVSLHLGNETFNQMLLPRCLDGVHAHDFHSTGDEIVPDENFGVLNDCLSLFLHNHRTKQFSIWQMKDFGNQKSWTLSLNIASQDLQIDCRPCHHLLPLIMFENGGVLMIDTTYPRLRAIVYDRRENILEDSKISCNTSWIYAMNYVQSLVSPRR